MRLINIFTIWYLGISALVLFLGGVLIFYKLESEIDFEQALELERQLDGYAKRLEDGKSPHRFNMEKLEISELPLTMPLIPFTVRDTMAWHVPLEQMERQLKVGRSYLIGDKHYYLSIYNIVIETSDITETVVQTMVAIFVLLLIFIAITGRLVSEKILLPFNQSLEQLKSFSFKNNEPLVFNPTKTVEFNRLNEFLHKLTKHLLKDYRVMKEFSENISHEIQTPVSVMRGKMELLLNTSINDQQAELIESAYQANEKINGIVKSLSVLARLENEEYQSSEEIDFSRMVGQALVEFEDLIAIKNLDLGHEIQPGIFLDIHPFMAQMLLNNLLNNSIKHSKKGGSVWIYLSKEKLEIKNTGAAPSRDVNEFFERFKKENKNGDSIGLGLSIIKQICILNGYSISYEYHKPFHWIKIYFRKF